MSKTPKQLAEERERFNHGHPVQIKAAQHARDKSNDYGVQMWTENTFIAGYNEGYNDCWQNTQKKKMSKKFNKIIEDYAESIVDLLINKDALNEILEAVYTHGRKDGFEAKQKATNLKDILGMTIEEYLYKHSEEIAEEVLNNNPLLKELKDE